MGNSCQQQNKKNNNSTDKQITAKTPKKPKQVLNHFTFRTAKNLTSSDYAFEIDTE